MKDRLGNEIEVGDKIAYATRYGSCGVKLGIGTVLEVHDKRKHDEPALRVEIERLKWDDTPGGTTKVWLSYSDRVVKVS